MKLRHVLFVVFLPYKFRDCGVVNAYKRTTFFASTPPCVALAKPDLLCLVLVEVENIPEGSSTQPLP